MRPLLSVLLLSCAAAAPVASPVPAPAIKIEARVHRAVAAPDTLIMSASWTAPVDDGKGPIDSLRVRFVGVMDDTSYIFRPPLPTSAKRTQVIPAAAYSGAGGNATFSIFAQFTTYRRSGNAVPLTSQAVSISLVDAAPANVTGVNFSAVKKP